MRTHQLITNHVEKSPRGNRPSNLSSRDERHASARRAACVRQNPPSAEPLTRHDAVTTPRPALVWRWLPFRLVARGDSGVVHAVDSRPQRRDADRALAAPRARDHGGVAGRGFSLCGRALSRRSATSFAVVISNNDFRISEVIVGVCLAGWLASGTRTTAGPRAARDRLVAPPRRSSRRLPARRGD